jgi:long-chain fatty acid transport protein
MNLRASRAAISALLALVVAAPAARAGVEYTTDLGAVALGQGGAFIAAPDTLASAWYNPAGLTRLRGLNVELEGGLISCPLSFDLAGSGGRPSSVHVENLNPRLPAGFFGASYDFGVPDLTLGVFAYVPSSSHYEFDPQGPQRFQAVGGSYRLAFFHAAVAYRLFERLSLGAALGPTYFSATQQNTISVAPAGDPESPDWAVPVNLAVRSPLFLSMNLGASFQITPALAVGASVMPPFNIAATGTVGFTLPPSIAKLATVEGDRLDALLRFPLIARAGVRYAPLPELSLEVASVYEGWSRLKAFELNPHISVSLPALGFQKQDLPPISLTKNYRDVISLRLGGEWRVREWLTARAGGFFESPGSSTEYFDITAPEANKFGATVGASARVGPVFIDFAYAHVFIPDVTVGDSQNRVDNVLVPANTVAIGNGVYRFSFDYFHLGLRFQYGGGGAR